MTSGNMANIGNIRNMASVNMLIRKCYLLAGVVMAANMFVVNELRASTNEIDIDHIFKIEKTDTNKFSITHVLDKTSWFLLNWENTINFIGGLVFSSANNYFKWWNYDRGKYWELGCWGLRSKRFLNGVLQFEANINLGRGILWLIPGTYNFIRGFYSQEDNCFYTSISVGEFFKNKFGKNFVALISFFIVFFLQGFFSAPLTVHISNFSFSISLDSLIWMGIGRYCDDDNQKVKLIENKKLLELSNLKLEKITKNFLYSNLMNNSND